MIAAVVARGSGAHAGIEGRAEDHGAAFLTWGTAIPASAARPVDTIGGEQRTEEFR